MSSVSHRVSSRNPTVNIILNKAFLLKSGQVYLLLSILFNTVQKFLASIIRQEKETKSIQIEKEAIKLSPYTDDMIMFKDWKTYCC